MKTTFSVSQAKDFEITCQMLAIRIGRMARRLRAASGGGKVGASVPYGKAVIAVNFDSPDEIEVVVGRPDHSLVREYHFNEKDEELTIRDVDSSLRVLGTSKPTFSAEGVEHWHAAHQALMRFCDATWQD